MYTYTYDGYAMWHTFNLARTAVAQVVHETRMQWLNSDDEAVMHRCSDYRQTRLWLIREMDKYPLHSVIEAAIKMSRPHDWQLMFFEWPHVSEGDRTRIAYTQSINKGQRDLQTVTSVGKYLRRHFPALSDHDIRDLVARHGSADTYKFVHTTAEMIYHLHRGPGSCMVWGENRAVRCHDGVDRHPYEAYDPKYGWHMAVRICGDDTVGRALCMTKPDGHKYFVRTYARPATGTNGYSQADNGMENWLIEQGYSKHSSWDDGEKLACHPAGDHFLAPYLDGGDKHVAIVGDNMYLVIDSDGDYICDQTGGQPTCEDEDRFECEDCGDLTNDDDGYWVGYNDDTHVCAGCYENDYVYGYGRNGRQYSFPSNDAVYVDSQQEYYHENWLDANNIIELANGEYEHIDDAVEVGGEWYHIDDENICRTTDTDEYLLKDDGCWQCAESGDWYTDSVDYVEIDNTIYHPDNAPATDDDEDDSDGDTAVAVDPVVATPPVVTTPSTALTIEMLNECALVEEYDHLRQRMTYSLTIMVNGLIFSTNRSYRDSFVQSQGADWMRMNVRRVLSNELLGLPQSSTETL